MNTIIGYTGFIGSNLITRLVFEHKFNSENIDQIGNYEHDLVICCGIPSLKWYANENPEEDAKNIDFLIKNLWKVNCRRFVLISTVSVYEKDQSYGKKRHDAEVRIKKIFGDKLTIVRLSSVFGDNLKKNILYDLINDKLYDKLNLCDTYQWYDVRDLISGIDFALENKLPELNLFTEPITMKEIVNAFFEVDPNNTYSDYNTALKYDYKCGIGEKDYWENKEEIMKKITNYLKNIK